MLDLLMILALAAAFVGAIAYVFACSVLVFRSDANDAESS